MILAALRWVLGELALELRALAGGWTFRAVRALRCPPDIDPPPGDHR